MVANFKSQHFWWQCVIYMQCFEWHCRFFCLEIKTFCSACNSGEWYYHFDDSKIMALQKYLLCGTFVHQSTCISI